MGKKKPSRHPMAALGRVGGLSRTANLSPEQLSEIGRLGGQLRAKALTAAERRAIGRKAAQARWARRRKKGRQDQ
jgi:general stress protein YciG